ncbi:MAG: DUF4365 domain-containing protein [Gemmataceae bacterium]|nr:DUF4365 domain-containing protein [Gemmataceae bacterium]MCI0737853.1 DUF4365 domain-containing protein [Gemmataceae bacterium]
MIADLSVHYVEGVILEAGYTVQRFGSDYGYDLLMNTFDEQGYAEPGSVYFQIKAEETPKVKGRVCVFDLDIRDYNLWIREKMPVILVLYDASAKRAYWLAIQQHFSTDVARQPTKGAKSVRVRVPKSQLMNVRAITIIRELKSAAIELEQRGGKT